MKKYLTKAVLYNILLALGLTVLLLMLVNWGLKVYTRHGKTLKVPELRGKKVSEAEDLLDNSSLDYVIMDSTYMPDLPPMSVIDQNPKPGVSVKAGRSIYLTINAANSPTADIPDLVGKSSFKYAKIQLEGLGFKIGEPIYKPDPHQGAVLGILINGRPIKPGSKAAKGSIITLLIGDGLTDIKLTVPYLIGLRYEEAILKLKEEYNLSIGAVVPNSDVTDTAKAFIWKQEPAFGEGQTIRIGEEIDLFLSKELSPDIEVHPEYYNKIDTVK